MSDVLKALERAAKLCDSELVTVEFANDAFRDAARGKGNPFADASVLVVENHADAAALRELADALHDLDPEDCPMVADGCAPCECTVCRLARLIQPNEAPPSR